MIFKQEEGGPCSVCLHSCTVTSLYCPLPPLTNSLSLPLSSSSPEVNLPLVVIGLFPILYIPPVSPWVAVERLQERDTHPALLLFLLLNSKYQQQRREAHFTDILFYWDAWIHRVPAECESLEILKNHNSLLLFYYSDI